MTDPRWFKLLVRAIGIVLIGIAIPSVMLPISYIPAFRDSSMGFATEDMTWYLIGTTLGGILQLALGGYLLFGAPRLVRYCVRQVHTRCPGCDYDIRGLNGACPECGVPVSSGQISPPPPPQ